MSLILLASFVVALTVGRQYPHQDGKRVLECLQKCLRIASSSIEEIVTVQLYCDALDEYLYYMDRGVPAVSNICT
jgi:vacuolar protein sorting-associated protein 35